MHCNSIKIILFALFSTALAQGQATSNNRPKVPPPNIPPNFKPAPTRRPSVPQVVYIHEDHEPDQNDAVVKTKGGRWMHMEPAIQMPNSLVPTKNGNIKVFETHQNQFKTGHTIVNTPGGVWDHYKPGRVPEDIVTKKSIELANKQASDDQKKEDEIRRKRKVKTQLLAPSKT